MGKAETEESSIGGGETARRGGEGEEAWRRASIDEPPKAGGSEVSATVVTRTPFEEE